MGDKQLFHSEDNYCPTVRNLFGAMTDVIARPDHFRDLIHNVKNDYPLYYNMRNCVPVSNQFLTKSGVVDEINFESGKTMMESRHGRATI